MSDAGVDIADTIVIDDEWEEGIQSREILVRSRIPLSAFLGGRE